MKKLKCKDEVIVIAGKDKGKRGTVQSIGLDGRVLVSGVNMVKRHTKGNPQQGITGGIIEKEAPIQISNVAIYNSSSSKADRVGIKTEDGKKFRVFKSNGEAIDA